MARKRKSDLELAQDFRNYLLWTLMGDNMGTKPEHELPKNDTTFAEKKAFLDSMLKTAELAKKVAPEKEEMSGIDLIRKNINDGKASRSKGNPWNPGESDKSGSDGEEGSEDEI